MHPNRLLLAAFAAFALAGPCDVTAGGVGVSTDFEPAEPLAASTTYRFYSLRPSVQGTFAFRDLELHWDSLYTSPGTGEIGLSGSDLTTLGNLGFTLADQLAQNPFNASLSDIHLVYEYFRSNQRPAYNAVNPLASSPFTTGPTFEALHWDGSSLSYVPDLPEEHRNVDYYLFHPARHPLTAGGFVGGGSHPAMFTEPKEDSSSGRWISPSDYTIYRQNSVMFDGPGSRALRTDLLGTGWTAPDSAANYGFSHEFQHSLRETYDVPTYVDEIFSSAAEALAGNADKTSRYEVPYTWNLLAGNNYQNWRLFGAYLLYNYRGNDTIATLAGFTDDLVHRWARGGKRMNVLRDQLSDANCPECARKPYFQRNGQPLDTAHRLSVLMHNWRVANFVNHPFLADSQYGFPPQFGFAPKTDLRPWQRLYNYSCGPPNCPDSVFLMSALPAELVVEPGMKTIEATQVGRWRLGTKTKAMRLQLTGSAYWVLRAANTLVEDGLDLVVRVDPESLFHQIDATVGWCAARDGRLMASVVGYKVEPASQLATADLWAHPEWARIVLDPQWVDVDSAAGSLSFVLPRFGVDYNAAVVVISLADGPAEGWTLATATGSSFFAGQAEVLPYRLNVALRKAPFDAVNPSLLLRTAVLPDDSPAWAPSGTEVAAAATIAAQSSFQQIYRQPIGGGSPTRLFPQAAAQFDPDWSPRGDWVAFGQDSGSYQYQRDIWLFNTQTSESRRLTFKPGLSGNPAFRPDGQALGYVRFLFVFGNQVYDSIEIRKANLDGTGDVAVMGGLTDLITSVKWSPDGTLIYFTRGDSLYSIDPNGGAAVPRFRLAPFATSFDFRPGSKDVVFEQAGSYRLLENCPENIPGLKQGFRRVAFRDTLNGDTKSRFYVTGAEFRRPRWSPDGTRIAYTSDQNAPGDRDIYMGQVSWNHAPKFVNAPRDTTLPSTCESDPFTRTFTAMDPDGEGVTFEAAFLPAGSSLSAGGVFTWPNPSAEPGDHYLVFRALDGAGGLDQRVVRYSVAADPARPAAVVDELPSMGKTSAVVNWTDVGDDSLTGSACRVRIRFDTTPITDATFFTNNDTIPNPGIPGPSGTVHCAELQEGALASCTWYYFALKTRDDAGNWSALSNVASGKTKCGGFAEVSCYGEGGGALMAQSSGDGGWSIENDALGSAVPDSLRRDRQHLRRNSNANHAARVRLTRRGGTGASLDAVELSIVDHAPDQGLFMTATAVLAGTLASVAHVTDGDGGNVTAALSAGNDVATAPAGSTWEIDLGSNLSGAQAFYIEAAGGNSVGLVTVETESSPGTWQAAATSTTRWNFDPLVVEAQGATRARVTFSNETTIRQVARVAVVGQPEPQMLALADAQHSKLGSVLAALEAEGGTESLLKPGEHMVLDYEQPTLATNQVRDYFVSVRGRRVHLADGSSLREARAEASSAAPEAPVVTFALRQAEPTPFSGSTRIRFDLPKPAWVHLDVFDLQGRRVANLADEFLTSGTHAREWNGTSAEGGRMRPGVYLYRIRAGENGDQKKLVLTP